MDCHFFVKEARGNGPLKLEVTQQERGLCRKRDYSWHKDYVSLACDFGVWDEGHNFDQARRDEVVVETDRRDFYFFWKHRPGMLLPAAKILQQREAEARQAARDRRLTLYGLWIAALALLANVYVEVAKEVKW